MSDLVAHRDLMPADVLLHHPRHWVSALIVIFDGGRYSHASIFDGSRVVEMDVPGIVTRSLDEFAATTSDIDVFRFASDDGHQLGSLSYPFEPILGRIRYYLKVGPRLAWGTFPVLAGLTLVRRISRSSPVLRASLDRLGARFAHLVATGRHALTCTELVYRCFAEAGDRYDLRIESQRQFEYRATRLRATSYLIEPTLVTAADLSRTPNLVRIGRLSI